jgi:hypothetical protein
MLGCARVPCRRLGRMLHRPTVDAECGTPSSGSNPYIRHWLSLTLCFSSVMAGKSFVLDFTCDVLIRNRYRTLIDRLLRLKLVPAQRLMKRQVSYEFMNRQMVWHAFTVSNHLGIEPQSHSCSGVSALPSSTHQHSFASTACFPRRTSQCSV